MCSLRTCHESDICKIFPRTLLKNNLRKKKKYILYWWMRPEAFRGCWSMLNALLFNSQSNIYLYFWLLSSITFAYSTCTEWPPLSHPLPDTFPPLSTFSPSVQPFFLIFKCNSYLVEKSQKDLKDPGDVLLYV